MPRGKGRTESRLFSPGDPPSTDYDGNESEADEENIERLECGTKPSTFVQHHEKILGLITDAEPGFANLVGDSGRGGDQERKAECEREDPVKFPDGWTPRFESQARDNAGDDEGDQPEADDEDVNNAASFSQPFAHMKIEKLSSGLLGNSEPCAADAINHSGERCEHEEDPQPWGKFAVKRPKGILYAQGFEDAPPINDLSIRRNELSPFNEGSALV